MNSGGSGQYRRSSVLFWTSHSWLETDARMDRLNHIGYKTNIYFVLFLLHNTSKIFTCCVLWSFSYIWLNFYGSAVKTLIFLFFEIDLGSDGSVLSGDERQISQILINLFPWDRERERKREYRQAHWFDAEYTSRTMKEALVINGFIY